MEKMINRRDAAIVGLQREKEVLEVIVQDQKRRMEAGSWMLVQKWDEIDEREEEQERENERVAKAEA